MSYENKELEVINTIITSILWLLPPTISMFMEFEILSDVSYMIIKQEIKSLI